MNKLQKVIRGYFSFSKRETNGFLFMSTATVVFLGLYLAISNPNNYSEEQRKEDEVVLEGLVAKIEQQNIQIVEARKKAYKSKYPKKNYSKSSKKWKKKDSKPLKPKKFNPNTVSKKELLDMEISEYWADRIINTRAKGWKFETKTDLAKLYNFPKNLFAQLESYIDLPDKLDYKKPDYAKENEFEKDSSKSNYSNNYKPYEKKVYAPKSFDLNLADTAELSQIRGIGTTTALRIIKHKIELGGFISTNQLSEVWGLKPEVVLELKKYASISNPRLRKLEINSLSLDELRVHPYVFYKQAKAIVNYRAQHGDYKNREDLRKVILLDKEFLGKIEPYVSFD
ncbi:MAG: DNA uptake protein ComE-like DNA-binding protein [Flammeovirgaceae bacterium]|jgi:competence protein ComEA